MANQSKSGTVCIDWADGSGGTQHKVMNFAVSDSLLILVLEPETETMEYTFSDGERETLTYLKPPKQIFYRLSDILSFSFIDYDHVAQAEDMREQIISEATERHIKEVEARERELLTMSYNVQGELPLNAQ